MRIRAAIFTKRRELPTVAHLLEDYAAAIGPWVKVGREVLAAPQFTTRLNECERCKWWGLRTGRAHCEHPHRKCAKLYAWLAAERCALSRWPALLSATQPTTKSAMITPPNTSLVNRAAERKARMLDRQKRLADSISLTESRLADMKRELAEINGALRERAQFEAELAATPTEPGAGEAAPGGA